FRGRGVTGADFHSISTAKLPFQAFSRRQGGPSHFRAARRLRRSARPNQANFNHVPLPPSPHFLFHRTTFPMPLRYTSRILNHLKHEHYEPGPIERLAEDLGVQGDDMPAFREAV